MRTSDLQKKISRQSGHFDFKGSTREIQIPAELHSWLFALEDCRLAPPRLRNLGSIAAMGKFFFNFLSLQRANEIYWKEKCGFSMHFKIKEITSIEKFQILKIFSVFLWFFNLGRFQTVTVTWHLHESESVKPGVFNGTFWNELRLFESPEPSTSKRTPHLVLPDCITKWWYRDPG